LGYEGDLEERQPRQHRLVIFARNELRQFLLRELRKGDAMSSRDLAERTCCEEVKEISDQFKVLNVTRRVTKAMGLLQKRGAVKGWTDSWGSMLGGRREQICRSLTTRFRHHFF
jgi:hypothetical protein